MPAILDPSPRRVLVTGAAGAIGACIVPALMAAGHQVRGFDRVPMPALPEQDQVVADLTDQAAIAAAVAERDVVIHLAAYPNSADFMEVLLEPNIIGTHHILQQSHEAGVPRVIIASSIQSICGVRATDLPQPVSPTINAPGNPYAVTKLFAEEYLRMYHLRHGMQGIAARIGWFLRSAREAELMVGRPHATAMYLSQVDAAAFFRACVEVRDLGYHQLWAMSGDDAQTDVYDLTPSKTVLGYEPQARYPQGLPADWPRG